MSNAPKKATYTKNEFEDLRNKNLTKIQLLAQEDRAMHPLSIIQCHLSALIKGLGLDWELEKEFEIALDHAAEELRMRKLTEGLSLPSFGKDSQ